MLWKKGNERFALLIVAVVAVFGLILMFQNTGDVTGFAAKKAAAKAKASPMPMGESASAGSAKVPPQPEGAKCDIGVRCAARLRCFQRVCQRLTCEDTDAANDPAVQGTATVTASVTGVAVTRSDKCNREMLEQVACPDAKYGRPEACPPGTGCENGVCVAPLPPPLPFEFRQFCEGSILHNQTVADQPDVTFDCSRPHARNYMYYNVDPDLPGNCVTIDESRATCGVCGKRTCFYGTHTDQARRHGSAYTTYIRPEEQCGANGQDLGVLQC